VASQIAPVSAEVEQRWRVFGVFKSSLRSQRGQTCSA
jgi:hypothetical protein